MDTKHIWLNKIRFNLKIKKTRKNNSVMYVNTRERNVDLVLFSFELRQVVTTV